MHFRSFMMVTLVSAFMIAAAPVQAQPALPCALVRITTITLPKGPARYQSGMIRLSNGASLQLSAPLNGPGASGVTEMRRNDPVAACYGHMKSYADAGPSRTITILDLRTAGYYGTLIGTW